MLPDIRHRSRRFHSQSGGITTLVALMLLVLLTIAAMGMSKNALREVIISGSARQGAMARNVADSGIEWSIMWLYPDNCTSGSAPAEASQFYELQNKLLADSTLSGVAWDITDLSTAYLPGTNTAVSLPVPSTLVGTTQAFSGGLTRMGKLPITDISQGLGAGAYTPAAGSELKPAPDLWAIRVDSQITVGGVVFSHAKEAWVSTPVRFQ